MRQPADAEVLLSEIRAHWRHIIDQVHCMNRHVAALLRDAQPLRMYEHALMIGSPYEYHVTELSDSRSKATIRAAVFEVTRADMDIWIVGPGAPPLASNYASHFPNESSDLPIHPDGTFYVDDDFGGWQELAYHETIAPENHGKGIRFIAAKTLSNDQLFAVAAIDSLTQLILDNTHVDSQSLVFASFPKTLLTLSLCNTEVDDIAFSTFSSFPLLQELDLAGTKITGDGMAPVTHLNHLTKLDVSDTALEDYASIYLSHCSNLQSLKISGTNISDFALERIGRLQSLTSLDAGYTEVTDKGIEYIATLPNLRWLDVSITRITDAALGLLQGNYGLKYLCVQGTSVGPDTIAEFNYNKSFRMDEPAHGDWDMEDWRDWNPSEFSAAEYARLFYGYLYRYDPTESTEISPTDSDNSDSIGYGEETSLYESDLDHWTSSDWEAWFASGEMWDSVEEEDDLADLLYL